MDRRRVLFLCTGNSARSQMAEGLVNHFLGEQWEVASAGVAPAGYVHPLAVRAMAELGVDISRHRSKSVDEFRAAAFDLIITVCDSAAQNCPLWLGGGKKLHLGFPDPAAVAAATDGGEDEQLDVFRRVRDGLREQVFAYLEQFGNVENVKAEVEFYATRAL